MTIEEFLENYKDTIREFGEADETKFNIFQVLGLEHYEIRHSSFLVWLLKNETFRTAFFRECGIQEELAKEQTIDINTEQSFTEIDENGDPVYLVWSKKDVGQVFRKGKDEKKLYQRTEDGSNEGYTELEEGTDLYREYHKNREDIGKEEKKKTLGRKIDLNMIGETYTLTIENKVYSDQHDNQCIAYRHYMEKCETYRGKHHHYVFLAPEKPEDFERSDTYTYKGYSFLDYETIVKILRSMLENGEWKDDLRAEIVRQYIEVIEGWTTFPAKYQAVFDKIDIGPFADENYEKTRKLADQMTGQQKRFVDYARQYYLVHIKGETDNKIFSVLQTISKDEYFIKEDYSDGKYAKAIPVSAKALEGRERYQYFLNRQIITQEEFDKEPWKKGKKDPERKKIEKRAKEALIEKNGNLNSFPFQTVDYPAPRGEHLYPSVQIHCGVNIDQSKVLCGILSKDDKLKELEALAEIGWVVSPKLGCKPGGGGPKRVLSMGIDVNSLAEMSEEDRTALFGKETVNKAMCVSELFTNEFWDYLLRLKKYVPDNVKAFGNGLLEKLIDENQSSSADESSLKDLKRNLDQAGLMADYRTWTEQNPLPQMDYTKITDLTGRVLNEKEIKILQNQYELERIKTRYKKDKKVNEGEKQDIRHYKEFTVLWELEMIYEVREKQWEEVFRKKTLEGVRPLGLESFFRDTIFKKPSDWSDQA